MSDKNKNFSNIFFNIPKAGDSSVTVQPAINHFRQITINSDGDIIISTSPVLSGVISCNETCVIKERTKIDAVNIYPQGNKEGDIQSNLDVSKAAIASAEPLASVIQDNKSEDFIHIPISDMPNFNYILKYLAKILSENDSSTLAGYTRNRIAPSLPPQEANSYYTISVDITLTYRGGTMGKLRALDHISLK